MFILALVAGIAGEVSSESVTLTTYYPAPSGVYTQLIATGNTYIARDSGKVGVGTASPTSKLQVNGSGGSNIDVIVNGRIQTGDGGSSGGVWLSNAGNMLVGQNGANVGFWTSGSGWNALQITQAGNVGIGNTAPAYKLDVTGTINGTAVLNPVYAP